MKVKYYKTDDILSVRLSNKPVDYAEESDWTIVNYTKDDKPVSIEILDASRYIVKQDKTPFRAINRSVFATV
jgi:uncharacterized protein YuzE